MSISTLFATLIGCNAASDGYKSVDVNSFESAIADTTIVRLDVRTAEEYAEGHIADAINFDVMQSDFDNNVKAAIPTDKVIALYCRSGKRSKVAAEILSKDGYQIIELNTGYLGWTGANKAVVK